MLQRVHRPLVALLLRPMLLRPFPVLASVKPVQKLQAAFSRRRIQALPLLPARRSSLHLLSRRNPWRLHRHLLLSVLPPVMVPLQWLHRLWCRLQKQQQRRQRLTPRLELQPWLQRHPAPRDGLPVFTYCAMLPPHARPHTRCAAWLLRNRRLAGALYYLII